jgi:pimeloyl-ACP methyl ester carboxylesterase
MRSHSADRINFFRGVLQSVRALYPELSRIDLFVQVPEVKIPVYLCLGRHDYEVPSVLSAKYFEALKAPRKQLVWFERSAHLPNTEEKDKFNEFMINTVLPTLPSRGGSAQSLGAQDAARSARRSLRSAKKSASWSRTIFI